MQNETSDLEKFQLREDMVFESPCPKCEIIYEKDLDTESFFANARITLAAINSGKRGFADKMISRLKNW